MSDRSIQEEQQIKKAVDSLSKKFLLGHENSQIKHKQGIVFIGNSRIGKSTISAIISGLKMHLAFDGYQYKIEPKEEKYRSNKNIIQHTLTSVTEFPNIYPAKINGRQFTVVDLPGFRDTSYEKQLCNWHYIKSILRQLDKILFVMVINVHTDKKNLSNFQLEMMKRFAQAFPCKSPHLPKENLITIVNFMENIEDEKLQDSAKTQIQQNISDQLKNIGLNLSDFYRKSLNYDRVFLMEKIKKKGSSQRQIKEGNDYENPKLLEFVRKNIVLMEQTQHSTYRINLTTENNQSSRRLRKVLIGITQKMMNDITENFQTFKCLFAKLLTRLAQVDGVVCDSNDYKHLLDHYKKQNLQQFQTIGIFIRQSFEANFQKTQQIVHEIVSHFYFMANNQDQNKKESDFKQMVQMAKENSFKFLSLMLILSLRLFKPYDYDKIEDMIKTIRKSIEINSRNLIYIYESVENFSIDLNDSTGASFQKDHCNDKISNLNDTIKRVRSFKNQSNLYLVKLLQTYQKLPSKKIDLKNLEKFKQSCTTFNFTQLKNEAIVLNYKTINKRLISPETVKNSSAFFQILEQIKKQQQKNDEFELIKTWKQAKSEWSPIKNKGLLQLLKLLKESSNKKLKIAEFYLKFNHSFEDLVEVMQSIVQDCEDQELGKMQAFSLCMDASQHLVKHREFYLAEKCCALAGKLYLFEDKDKVIEAKLKSIQIKNLMMLPIDQKAAKAELEANPWTEISDSDYNEIVNLVVDAKDLIEQRKKQQSQLQMTKILSKQSNNSIERERKSPVSPYQSPVRNGHKSPELKPLLAKQEERKPKTFALKSLKD